MPAPATAAATFSAPATRMLLTSDGSTTLLLQALLGEELTLTVPQQGRSTAGTLPPRVRSAIGVTAADRVLIRHSELRTATGVVVSRNLVVANESRGRTLNSILDDRDTPLGFHLITADLSQSRRLLETGLATWEDETAGGLLPCAFKSYVLTENGTPTLYVHERFSPTHVCPEPS